MGRNNKAISGKRSNPRQTTAPKKKGVLPFATPIYHSARVNNKGSVSVIVPSQGISSFCAPLFLHNPLYLPDIPFPPHRVVLCPPPPQRTARFSTFTSLMLYKQYFVFLGSIHGSFGICRSSFLSLSSNLTHSHCSLFRPFCSIYINQCNTIEHTHTHTFLGFPHLSYFFSVFISTFRLFHFKLCHLYFQSIIHIHGTTPPHAHMLVHRTWSLEFCSNPATDLCPFAQA